MEIYVFVVTAGSHRYYLFISVKQGAQSIRSASPIYTTYQYRYRSSEYLIIFFPKDHNSQLCPILCQGENKYIVSNLEYRYFTTSIKTFYGHTFL